MPVGFRYEGPGKGQEKPGAARRSQGELQASNYSRLKQVQNSWGVFWPSYYVNLLVFSTNETNVQARPEKSWKKAKRTIGPHTGQGGPAPQALLPFPSLPGLASRSALVSLAP